jgi:hypothetical protein
MFLIILFVLIQRLAFYICSLFAALSGGGFKIFLILGQGGIFVLFYLLKSQLDILTS